MLTLDVRQINVTLDLYSISICFIIGIYLLFNIRKNKSNRYLFFICLSNILMMLGDLTNWLCEGFGNPWNPIALRCGSLVYYLSAAPLLFSFFCYINSYLSDNVRVKKRYWYISVTLCAVFSVLCILSLYTGSFFWIDENNFYRRGNLFILSQAIPLILLIADGAVIVEYRKNLSKKEIVVLFGYIVLPIAAELIQVLNYGVSLLNSAVTLAIMFIFIGIQNEREILLKNKEAELAESQISIMLSQIQPHFLFNALTAIRSLCDTEPQRAKQAIGEFSKYLRVNMESLTNRKPISFNRELEHTKSYLNIEKQRFGEKLKIVYKIQTTDFVIPPLTVQPIAENAVRHGILKNKNGGTLVIETMEVEDAYLVIISDDGVGFSIDDVISNNDGHVGIYNVKSRLDALCGGKMRISSEPGRGTRVTINIPKNHFGRD